MKTSQNSTRWLGVALACGTLTFAVTTQAGKPVKPPPPPTPAYVSVLLGGLRSSDGVISTGIADLNNAGQVAGGTCLPGYDSAHHGQAFLLNPRDNDRDGKPDTWFVDEVQNATGAPGADGQNDLIIGLGYLPGNASSGATAVNDLGFVVGSSDGTGFVVVPKDTDGDGRADSWYKDVNPQDGFNDLMVSLGSDYAPEDINNAGWIVGTYRGSGFLLIPTANASGAVEWFRDNASGGNALAIDLGTFIPSSINDSGQIIGTVVGRAVLRNPDGSQINLGAAGIDSQGVAINNAGQIGIWFRFSLELCREGHAGLLTPLDANNDGTVDTWYKDQNGDGVNDLIIDLGVVERMLSTGLPTHALNDAGSVVAVSCNYRNGYHRTPFLWQGGLIQTLTQLTGGATEFWNVSAINNASQIACEIVPGGACILLPTR